MLETILPEKAALLIEGILARVFSEEKTTGEILQGEKILGAVAVVAEFETEAGVDIVDHVANAVRVCDENIVIVGDASGNDGPDSPHAVIRFRRQIEQLHFLTVHGRHVIDIRVWQRGQIGILDRV